MGRPKGTANRYSEKAKADLQAAFVLLGGVEGLVAWGRTNPTAFYALWSKLIPRAVDVAVSENTGPQIVLNAVEVTHPEEALSALEKMTNAHEGHWYSESLQVTT